MTVRRRFNLAIVVTTWLASCAGPNATPAINVLADAEQSLTIADQVALTCIAVVPYCQQPVVKAQIKAAAEKAYTALAAARIVVLANPSGGSSVDAVMTDVRAALAAYTAITSTLPKS